MCVKGKKRSESLKNFSLFFDTTSALLSLLHRGDIVGGMDVDEMEAAASKTSQSVFSVEVA